jgi:hypothetical protein
MRSIPGAVAAFEASRTKKAWFSRFKLRRLRQNRRATYALAGQNSPGGSPTIVSVGSVGAQSTGVGVYGPSSVGAGLSIMTPIGVPTTTGGFNEAQDYLKSIGGGVMEISAPINAKGQFIFRNGVTVRGNNFLLTNSSTNAQCPNPFLTDVDTDMANKTDLYGIDLNCDAIARLDTIINAPGATTIGASPYTYTNSLAYYVLIGVFDGTVSAISINGNSVTSPSASYGIFALPPNGTLTVTYTAGAGTTPTMVLLAAGMSFGSGNTNNFDVTIEGTAAGNGIQGCGWANALGTYLGNNGYNHYHTLGTTSTTGLFAYRFLGAGGGNNYAFVNNQIDLIYAQGHSAGGVNAGYGIDFAYHSDSNHINMAYLVSNSGAAAGSYNVVFNDNYFSETTSSDVKVNANTIDWLVATPNAAGTNCGTVLTNYAGLTAQSGGENAVLRLERLQTLTPAQAVVIQNGGNLTYYDSTVTSTVPYTVKSQPNQLGVTPTFWGTGGGSNTVATASTTYVMAGLATAGGTGAGLSAPSVFTPVLTGNLKVTIKGNIRNTTAADGYGCRVQYSSGTAPITGAATTGSTAGDALQASASIAGGNLPFCHVVIITGRTLGTQQWIDLGFLAITGGTVTLTNIDVIIEELAA